MGVKEPWDVAAAVAAAQAFAPERPVVALGVSLGGGVAPRRRSGQPGGGGGVGVRPAWRDLASPSGVRLSRWLSTRRGQVLLLALSGTRVDVAAVEPELVEYHGGRHRPTLRRHRPRSRGAGVRSRARRDAVPRGPASPRPCGGHPASVTDARCSRPSWPSGCAGGRAQRLAPGLDERRRRLDQVGALLLQAGDQLPPVGHHRPGPRHAAQPVHALRPSAPSRTRSQGRRGTRRRGDRAAPAWPPRPGTRS